ncbi:hypothetical protein F2Q68_00045881 [Brassica cretica]|uniref:RanBP2-type domain-containing protein n=1 Tax=Brassica cretica TaxID=69181 RepID=A0A8S9LQ17_BRACR|nr:hypothetical protein F2Q68_00045881 [Brassica cretica]
MRFFGVGFLSEAGVLGPRDTFVGGFFNGTRRRSLGWLERPSLAISPEIKADSHGVHPKEEACLLVDNRNSSAAKRARTDGGRREDDWTCPSCGNVNFSFRTTCNMRNCTQSRPADHNGAGEGLHKPKRRIGGLKPPTSQGPEPAPAHHTSPRNATPLLNQAPTKTSSKIHERLTGFKPSAEGIHTNDGGQRKQSLRVLLAETPKHEQTEPHNSLPSWTFSPAGSEPRQADLKPKQTCNTKTPRSTEDLEINPRRNHKSINKSLNNSKQ